MLRSSLKWESRHEFVPVEETASPDEQQQGRAPDGFPELLVRLVKAVLINKPLCIYQCMATTLEAELDRRTLWEMQFNQYSRSVPSSSLVGLKVPFHLLPSRNREVGDSRGIPTGDPASTNLTSGSDEQELAFLLECLPNSEKSSLDAKRLKPFLAFELPHADADSTRDEIRVASRSVPQYSTLLAAKAEGMRRHHPEDALSARASGVMMESVLGEPSKDGTAADDIYGSRALDPGIENLSSIIPVKELLLRGHNPLATDGDQAEFQDRHKYLMGSWHDNSLKDTALNEEIKSTDADSRGSVLARDSLDRPSYIPRGDRLADAMLYLDAKAASVQDLESDKDAADTSDTDQYADALNKIFDRFYREPERSRSGQVSCDVPTTYDAAITASNPVLQETSETAFPRQRAVRTTLQRVSNAVRSSNDLACAADIDDDGRVMVDEHQTTYPENSSQDQDVPHSYLTRETDEEKQEYRNLSCLDSTETDDLEYTTPPNVSFRREEVPEEEEFHTPRAVFPRDALELGGNEEMSATSVHDLRDSPLLASRHSEPDEELTADDSEIQQFPQSNRNQSRQSERLKTEFVHGGFLPGKEEVTHNNENNFESVIDDVAHNDESSRYEESTNESVVESVLLGKEPNHDQEITVIDRETYDESQNQELSHIDESTQDEELAIESVVEGALHGKESRYDKEIIVDSAISEIQLGDEPSQDEGLTSESVVEESLHVKEFAGDKETSDESAHPEFQHSDESAQGEELTKVLNIKESTLDKDASDRALSQEFSPSHVEIEGEGFKFKTEFQEFPHTDELPQGEQLISDSYSQNFPQDEESVQNEGFPSMSASRAFKEIESSSLEEEMPYESTLGEETDMPASLMDGEIMNFESVNDEEASKDSVVSGQCPQKVVIQEGTTSASMFDEENPAVENVEMKMSDVVRSAEIALGTLPDEEMIRQSKLSEEISPERREHTEEICEPENAEIRSSGSVFRQDIASESPLLEEIHTKSEHGEMNVSHSRYSKDPTPQLLLREVIPQHELEHFEGRITDSFDSKPITSESPHDEDTAAVNLQADTQQSSESLTETVNPEDVSVRPVIEPLFYGKNTYTNFSHASESDILDVMNKPTMSEEKAANMLEWDEMNLDRRESDASLRKQDASNENPNQDDSFPERDEREPSVTESESDSGTSQPSLEVAVDHPDCFSNFSTGPSLGREARIRLKWYSISTSCSDVLEEEDEDDESNVAGSSSRFEDEGARDGQTTLQDDSRSSEELAQNQQEESTALHSTKGEASESSTHSGVVPENSESLTQISGEDLSVEVHEKKMSASDGPHFSEAFTGETELPKTHLVEKTKEMEEDDQSDVVKEYQAFDEPNQIKSSTWDVDTGDEIQVDATMATSGKHWNDETEVGAEKVQVLEDTTDAQMIGEVADDTFPAIETEFTEEFGSKAEFIQFVNEATLKAESCEQMCTPDEAEEKMSRLKTDIDDSPCFADTETIGKETTYAVRTSGTENLEASDGETCKTEEQTESKKEDVLTTGATVADFSDEAVKTSISHETVEEKALIEMPADELQSTAMLVIQRDVKESADDSRTLDSERETDEPVARFTEKSAGEKEPKETNISFESSSNLSHPNLPDQQWFDSQEGQLHSVGYSTTHVQLSGKESDEIDTIQEFKIHPDSPVTEVAHSNSRKDQGTSAAERDYDETIKPEKAVILFAAAPDQTNIDSEHPRSDKKTEEESAVEGQSVEMSPVHSTYTQDAGEDKDDQEHIIVPQKVPFVFAAASAHGHADTDEPNVIDEGDRIFHVEPDKGREERLPSFLPAHPQLVAKDSEEMDVIQEIKDYGEDSSSRPPTTRSQWDTSFEDDEIIVPQKVDIYSAAPIHKCHSKSDSESKEKVDFPFGKETSSGLNTNEKSSREDDDENAVNDRALDDAPENHPTDVFGLPPNVFKASDETKLTDSIAPSNKSSKSKSCGGKNVPVVEHEEIASEWPPVPQFLSPYYDDEDNALTRRSTVYYSRNDDDKWPGPINRRGSPGSDFSDSDYEEASIYSTEPVTAKRHVFDSVSRQNAPDSSDVAAAAEVSENKVVDGCDTKVNEEVQAVLNAQAPESEDWPPLPEFALLHNESDGMESKNSVGGEAQSATGATVGDAEDRTNVGDLTKASDDDELMDSSEQWPPLPDFILEELVSGRSRSNLCSILNIIDAGYIQKKLPASSSEFPVVAAEQVGLLRSQGRARIDPFTQETIYGADGCDADVTDKISFAGLLSQTDRDELSEFLNEDDVDREKPDEQTELNVVNQLVLDIVSSAKQSVQEFVDKECLTTSESAPTEEGITSALLDFGSSEGPLPTDVLSADQTAASDEFATDLPDSESEEASIYWTRGATIAKGPPPPVVDSVSLQSSPDEVALATASENTSKITGPEDNEAGFEVRQFCAVASSAFTDLTKVTGSQGDMKSHHNIQSHIELGIMACQSWSDLDIPPCGSSKSLQLIGAPELSSWSAGSDEANRKWREDDQVGRRQVAEADVQSTYTGGEAIRNVVETEDVDSGCYKIEATEEPLLGCRRDSASVENERGSRGSSVHIWMPVEEEGLLDDNMASKGSGVMSSPMESREKPSQRQSSDVPEAFAALEGTAEPSGAVGATETVSISVPKECSSRVTESSDEGDRRKESNKVELRDVPVEFAAALRSTSSLTGENVSDPKQENIFAGTLDIAKLPSGGSNWETDLSSATEPQKNDSEVLSRELEEFEKDDVTVASINESTPFTGNNSQIRISSVEETTSDGFVVPAVELDKQTETSPIELVDSTEISASQMSDAQEPQISGDLDAPQEAAVHSAPANDEVSNLQELCHLDALNRVSCSLCKTDRTAMAEHPDTAAAPLSDVGNWVQMGRTWYIEDEIPNQIPTSRKTEEATKGLSSFSSALTATGGDLPISEYRAGSPTFKKVERVDEEVKLAISTEPESSSENDKHGAGSESVSTISLTGANSRLDCPQVVKVEDDNAGLDQDDWVQDEADEVVSGEEEHRFLPSASTLSEQTESGMFSDASKPGIEHQSSFDTVSEQLALIQPDSGTPVLQLRDSMEVTNKSEISSTDVNLELVDDNVVTDVEESDPSYMQGVSFPLSSGPELGSLRTSSLSNQLESADVDNSSLLASLPLKGEDEDRQNTQEEEQLSVSRSDLHKSLTSELSPIIHRVEDVEPRTESLKWEDKMQDKISSAFNVGDESMVTSEDGQTVDSDDVKQQVDISRQQHEDLATVNVRDPDKDADSDANKVCEQDIIHTENENNLDNRNEDQDVNQIWDIDIRHCESQDKTQGEVHGTEPAGSKDGKEEDREDRYIDLDHHTGPTTTLNATDGSEDISKELGLGEASTTEENDECVQPIPPHSTKSEIDLVFSLHENQAECRLDSDAVVEPLNKGSASPTMLTGGKDVSIIPVYVVDESPRSKSPSASPVFLVATQHGGYKIASLEEQNTIGATGVTESERESQEQNEMEQSLNNDVQKTYFGTTSPEADDGALASETTEEIISVSKVEETSASETDGGDTVASNINDDGAGTSKIEVAIVDSEFEDLNASKIDEITDPSGAEEGAVTASATAADDERETTKNDDATTVEPYDGAVTSEVDIKTADDATITSKP